MNRGVGTKTSSTTTVLLPVPRNPEVCHVSAMCTSAMGMTANAGADGDPSSSVGVTTTAAHEAWRDPEA
ncbi:hypothetical protein [Mycolicibacterium smegmatis]|uniref:hypothetical protein n=1 Tax=Mycolicibacterium smegmatis TaxID=1772 RepID=UPI0004905ACC|nr:hypothetical protein [Mycolicibacterium smegmatis]AIU10159.1 hypothetical protein LJ00_25330 [Mycolicibacterium smegmatis MC2 155]AIU16784.1 hypothetical protein LI99_25335 [Mycolicibacterium smegmatis]AIU23407.1 hypothetical protein LI98_25340 [Mycolicibacterium smegmatis]MBE9621508.1 hypothetical protein [Mycolicibacterium smegmatis]MBE9627873.1 hypothetical protein [Mycolicibacterium smegmatis]